MANIEDETKTVIRDWLQRVKQATGWSWTAIAKAAGVATSTLTKAAKSGDDWHVMSTVTIAKISQATGVAPPAGLGGGDELKGLAAPEAMPYGFDGGGEINGIVKAFIAGRSGVDAWILRTRALDLAGYLPGDILIVDLNAKAKPGDIVTAQVYDYDRMRAETIWRRYEPPYLLAASTAAFTAPERDDKVQIKGVVLASFRPRGSAAKAG